MSEPIITSHDILRALHEEIEAGDREIEALRQDGSRLTEHIRVLREALERYVDHFGDPLRCARAALEQTK